MDKCILIILIVLSTTMYSQEKNHRKAFLKSFDYGIENDTVLMLSNFKIPSQFGCGTGAVEYSKQLRAFDYNRSGVNLRNDLKFMKLFQEKVNFTILWSYLYGSLYTRNLETGNEEETNFEGSYLDKLLKNKIRLSICFEKKDRKHVVYYVNYTDIQKNIRIEESYFLSRSKRYWALDEKIVKTIEGDY